MLHALRSTRGFTLLEMLITVTLFSVGIAFVLWAFSTGIFAKTDTENVDLALAIAQGKMEELQDTAFSSLVDSGPTADANFPNFSVQVDVAAGNDPMQVDVIVRWNTKGGQTSITLTTLRANF